MDVANPPLSVDELTAKGCDPRLHVGIEYYRENLQHEGTRVTGPLPEGMSGGAVWHRSADNVLTLLAIATDCPPGKKFLRGTRLNPLLVRLREHLRTLMPPEKSSF